MAMLARAGVADHVDVVVNCVDKDAMFGGLKVLVLPSRMEASSNAALEAFSRGVPVIAARHAAGPADLITHCRNGLLLDEWDADAAVDGIESLAGPRLRAMSAAAFDKHKLYTMDAHLAVVERVAGEALARFHASNRTNVLPVFPRLQWDRSAGMQDGARREACRAPPSTTTPPIAGAPRPAGQPPAPSLKLSASTRRQRRLMARSQPETTAPGSGGAFIVTTHRARAHRRAHAKPHVHWPRASGRANDSVCERIGRVDDALPSPSPTGPHLRRIVMMVPDLSHIGGQETRVRNLVKHRVHDQAIKPVARDRSGGAPTCGSAVDDLEAGRPRFGGGHGFGVRVSCVLLRPWRVVAAIHHNQARRTSHDRHVTDRHALPICGAGQG
jgi:hypothetical protein